MYSYPVGSFHIPNKGLTPVQRGSANKLPTDVTSAAGKVVGGIPICLAWHRGSREVRYEGLMGLRLDSESTGERGDNGNVPKGENAPVGEEGRLSGGVCIPNGAPPAIKLP